MNETRAWEQGHKDGFIPTQGGEMQGPTLDEVKSFKDQKLHNRFQSWMAAVAKNDRVKAAKFCRLFFERRDQLLRPAQITGMYRCDPPLWG